MRISLCDTVRSRGSVIITLCALMFASSCLWAAEPLRIATEEQLLDVLCSHDSIQRREGTKYLRRLGPSHVELAVSLLDHEHHEVRTAAFGLLGDAADVFSKAILRESLADTARLRKNWLALGNALLAARDIQALPLLLELADSHPNEYVRYGCRRTAEHMEAETWGEPPLSVRCGSIECNFLLDDVECVCVRNELWGFVRIIFPYYYEDLFAALCSGEPPPPDFGSPMHHTEGYLHIELSDGRTAEIEINEGGEFTLGGHLFTSAQLEELVGRADVPSALPWSVRRCSELNVRESSN